MHRQDGQPFRYYVYIAAGSSGNPSSYPLRSTLLTVNAQDVSRPSITMDWNSRPFSSRDKSSLFATRDMDCSHGFTTRAIVYVRTPRDEDMLITAFHARKCDRDF